MSHPIPSSTTARRDRRIALGLALWVVTFTACLGGGSKQEVVSFQGGVVEPRHVEEIVVKPLSFAEELTLADSLRDNGQMPEAAWHYLRGLQLDTQSPLPRQRMGFLQLGNDVPRSERIFAGLTEKHPEMSSAHLGLGLSRIALGDLDGGRAALHRSLELDPDSAAAYTGLGYIADLEQRYGDAEWRYRQALRLQPQHYEILNNLGMSYLLSGQSQQAAEVFRQSLYVFPRDPTVYNNLGVALARMGRYDDALENLTRYAPEADALNNLGLISH